MNIGILLLMHDKSATIRDFQQALGPDIHLHWFTPQSHPLKQPDAQIHPLSLTQAIQMDAFIVTGAPIDRLDFTEVHYYPEVTQLLDVLTAAEIPQLNICWGAMAALHHHYGINKVPLPRKLFGAFAHRIVQATPLLANLPNGFLAPHARYVDIPAAALIAEPALTLNATTTDGHPLLATANAGQVVYLFAHLEYRRIGLWQEHLREDSGPLPLHDTWSWQTTQETFFTHWLTIVK
ncbi:MAG: homoserine O-succinyltransferase [Lactobacillus sp.]|jgi:homoserine O-succinyltransferase|nr:homoserine O-succinyltransferase [Lactobacillus sp.]MCI2033869.1 homoserine O-succinyltransferase [Lactobacillus sp.]